MTVWDAIYEWLTLDFIGPHALPSNIYIDAFIPILFWLSVAVLFGVIFRIMFIVIKFIVTLGGSL